MNEYLSNIYGYIKTKGETLTLTKEESVLLAGCFFLKTLLANRTPACGGSQPTMEAWPTVARVLLLALLADWPKNAQSRDFTVKDIILLHPSSTPHPGGFKCFTCKDSADNYECNRWAPDVYCPRETRYCYTLHMMDVQGDSVSVTKRCVALEDCLSTGCTDVNNDGYQVCISCCEGNICNLQLPRNKTGAVFSTSSPLRSATLQLSSTWLLPGSVVANLLSITLASHT
ncbi:ly6/PLAUR domain-containing protein 6-like [Osmerus mordax]|uniref:ly6/PLAUR domain-containing protein 6-like n=1 Tax=Osmerus mordax TaxID=8014 RepID=UPI00350FFBF4